VADSRPHPAPRRIVVTGKAISLIVAHAPWAWPLIRRAVMRFFDALAKDWDSRPGSDPSERLAAIAAAVLKVDRSPERVLDIGCGTGSATMFLAREFPRATVRGVDLSPGMIRQARQKIGLDPEARVAFREGDASKLPFPDAGFDLVAQNNMPVFFKEISRVLRPGGCVVIASSFGPETPFSTDESLVGRRFEKLGIETMEIGSAGAGTFFIGRKVDPAS
jgi:ubiquinone/menaquinone biosynthesis C-methylase UbiE